MKEKSEEVIKRNKYIIIALWSIFGIGLMSVAIFFTLIYKGAIGYMPPVDELLNPVDNYASVIYSS
ncbi:MAG: hypothetical protein K2J07_05570, partial [Muribaculaceae bacterium]|nr:hypothetical protein [Muribaculaceae bacterium]